MDKSHRVKKIETFHHPAFGQPHSRCYCDIVNTSFVRYFQYIGME